MTISVDIVDRLYDYTDEEKAAEAIQRFQDTNDLSDAETVAIWNSPSDPRRPELEQLVIQAIEGNGSVKRARESVPANISLVID